MRIVLVQTCDATSGYKGLMDVTRQVNEKYCEKWGYEYRAFVGMKRGFHPWHATFNRIYLMEEVLKKTDADWVVYLDADAYVHNLETRLEEIIFEDDNATKAFIFCTGGGPLPSDINAGVFFMNAKSPFAAPVISLWKTYYESILTDDILFRAPVPWSICSKTLCVQDQSMLEAIFKTYDEMGVLPRILRTYQDGNGGGNRFNYDGAFIKQLIRPHMGSRGPCIEERIAAAKRQVASGAQEEPLAPQAAPAPVAQAVQAVQSAPVHVVQAEDKEHIDTPMWPNSSQGVTRAVLMNCGGFVSEGIYPGDDFC